MKAVLIGLLVLAMPMSRKVQFDTRPAILVLGTYHMSNPGHDVHNSEVDDISSTYRQGEMTQLIEVLKQFRPTKIAVEASVTSQRVRTNYANYLAGKYPLSRNEIDQIGFRLAKELGHSTIYPVDEDGEFSFYRVRNYAIANGVKDKFDLVQARVAARVKREDAFLREHTLLETLSLLNADSTVATAVAEYYAGFLPFGEPYEYAGSDLIASWLQRNLRIYRNITALVTQPEERILVIYGAGHLGWLRQIVESDASVQLRKLADLQRPQ